MLCTTLNAVSMPSARPIFSAGGAKRMAPPRRVPRVFFGLETWALPAPLGNRKVLCTPTTWRSWFCTAATITGKYRPVSVCLRFGANLSDGGGGNLAAKRRQLDHYLKPFFAAQRLDAISSFAVDRYKRRRLGAGASKGTVNLELATLSHVFSRAVEWGWLKARPCRITMLEKSQGRIIALSDDQADALLTAATADEDPYCWLFVAFGLNTAMRHAEILRARFDQLDLDHNRLLIPQAKAGMREQPITPELATMLKREREMAEDRDGWIFPSPRPNASLTGHRDRMDKPFRRAVIAAKLDPKVVTPHIMRHTAITNLVKAGVDLPTIQRISGHKTVAMVLRYTHVHGDHIDRAIALIGRAIPEPSANRIPDTTTQGLHTEAANIAPLARRRGWKQ